MESFTFTCAAAASDNWSDWHFYLKTFFPAISTASVACVGVFIARAQKKISTQQMNIADIQKIISINKYDLDLFDKRYPLFDKINVVYEKVKNYDDNILYKKYVDDSANDDLEKKFQQCDEANVKKIQAFNTEIIVKNYEQITKSSRLYKGISAQLVEDLKKNVKSFEEIKKYEIAELMYISDITPKKLKEHTSEIYHKAIPNMVNRYIDYYRALIEQSRRHINGIRRKDEDYKLIDENGRNKAINHHEILIKGHEDKIEKIKIDQTKYKSNLDEFDKKITDAFKLMRDIKTAIINMHREMDKHLTISEKAY